MSRNRAKLAKSSVLIAHDPAPRARCSWTAASRISAHKSEALGSSFLEDYRSCEVEFSTSVENVELSSKSAFLSAVEKVKILSSKCPRDVT